MFYFSDSILHDISVHYVGNNAQDGPLVISKNPIQLKDDSLKSLLNQYFLTPFSKTTEAYNFFHHNGEIDLNPLYHFIKKYFDQELEFHEFSVQAAKHLYQCNNHPNIKEGELYVVEINEIPFEGNVYKGIGLFKSESKETFLKVYPQGDGFEIDSEENAINIQKLDKGALILQAEEENGYVVFAVDQTNKQTEAVYWKDTFLSIKSRNDAYSQTKNFLKAYKQFVNHEMDEIFEIEKADKVDLLNKSMDYFKNKEDFKEDEFVEEVLGNPVAIDQFKSFKDRYAEDFDNPFETEFQISAPIVKKMQSTYKSILKLDKNFHIYIHGKREYIEKGFDEDKGMNFYKIYFENEL